MNLKALSPGRKILVRLITWTTILIVYAVVTYFGFSMLNITVRRVPIAKELEQRVSDLESRVDALEKNKNP